MVTGGQLVLQDRDWRRRNSMWMVPSVVCCGAMTWVSFLYIGFTAKRPSWLAAAAAYGVAFVASFVLVGSGPTTADGSSSSASWQSSVGSLCLLAVWIGGSVHALLVNRQWLAFLASSPDLAAAPRPAAGPPMAPPRAPYQPPGAPYPPPHVQPTPPRAQPAPPHDPFAPPTLDDPWRWFVSQALGWQREIMTAVDNTPPGPMRDRLQLLTQHVDTGIAECWHLAQGGQRLRRARARINTTVVAQQLDRLQASESNPSLTQAAQSLQAQLDTATRIERQEQSTYNGLLLLNARLGEVAARVIELSVRPHALNDVSAVESVVDSVVSELSSIRQALTELDG